MPLKTIHKILLLITVLLASLSVYNFSGQKTAFHGDALGYYQYLPSVFIYKNLLTNEALPANNGIREDIINRTRPVKDEKDTASFVINQYTYGVALMESPFFAMAHLYEVLSGAPANGYSETYEYLVKISALFYALLGLILVFKILSTYYETSLSLIATIVLFTGTNLFWFSIFQAGMSHVILFFLYALLIYLTIKAHDTPRSKIFSGIGLTIGMITIIRPTDIVCIAIPLLYNVYDIETIRRKIRFIQENLANMLLLFITFVAPILPQLIYWKIATGKFLYYSYREQSFDWAHPKILEGLLHYSNGWLPYSPVLIFSVAGLFFYKSIRPWAWCCWLLLPVYVYIIYSWYCYRYINGLGSRPMIHMLPLLAIPLGAVLRYISEKGRGVKISFGITTFFLVAVNLNFSYQQFKGLIWSEESNMAYNMQMLFRTELQYDDLVVKDVAEFQPDTAKITRIQQLACDSYSDSLSAHFTINPVDGSKYVYHMINEELQSTSLTAVYNKANYRGAKWIKCSGRFFCPTAPTYFRHLLVLDIPDKLWKGCKIENKIFDTAFKSPPSFGLQNYKLNTWGYVHYFAKIPADVIDGDIIKLYLWSPDKVEIYADDLCLEIYK